MELLDKVTTPDGEATVVGFPDELSVEVRAADGNLRICKRSEVQPAGSKPKRVDQLMAQEADAGLRPTEPADDGVPRSASGRKLGGVALRKHLAKLEREGQEGS